MGKALLLAIAVGLVGCGGEANEPSPLVGNWILVQGDAAVGMDFNADGRYGVGVIRTATDGVTINGQIERGTYSASERQVTFSPEQWTCPGMSPSHTFNYRVSPGSLTIEASDGVQLFMANAATGGSAQLTYGCFADDGTFTARPLGPAR